MKNIKIDIKKYSFLISFFLGMICMYMTLSYAGVLRSGKYCILEGDLLEQYVPVIREFYRNILNRDNPYFSWNKSLGMNNALCLAYYGAYNPLNFVYCIFYKIDPNITTAFLIVLKTGIAALSFHLYSKIVLKLSDTNSIVFSVLYSMCSFQVAYGIINFVWMDALYILPFVIISIYILRTKLNPLPLIISFAYIFIAQFYMGYIIGVFAFLYIVLSLIIFPQIHSKTKILFLFVASGLIAFALSSFAWMPTLFYLLNSGIRNSNSFSFWGINPLDFYNQLFFSNNNSIVEIMPNIYCGILSLLLLPIFFIDKRNDLKKKLFFGSFLFAFVLSCLINPLNMFWHAYDTPDGWPHRFSFCISFVVATIAANEFKNIKEIKDRLFFFVLIGNMLVYSIEIILLKRPSIAFTINSIPFLLINFVIFSIWIGSIILFKKSCGNPSKEKSIAFLLVLLACFECVGNGVLSYYKGYNYYTVPETNEVKFYGWYQNQKEIVDYLSSDDSFYRVNTMGDYVYNSDTFSGFNGVNDFFTAENVNVRKALNNLGFATSRKIIRNFGITPVTKMILGIKYDIDLYPTYVGLESSPPIEKSELSYVLPIGYMVSDDILDFSFKSSNPFKNINELLLAMTGKKINIFNELDKRDFYVEESGVTLLEDDYGYIFSVNDDNKFASEDYNDSLSFVTKESFSDKDLFIYFDNELSEYNGYSMVIDGGFENRSELGGYLSRSYIKQFEKYYIGDSIVNEVIVYSNGIHSQRIKDYYLASYNKEMLTEAYDILSQNTLNIIEWGNGYIKGNVISEDNYRVLFTSIPYDLGWKVLVDGKEGNIIPFLDNAFIGINLSEGYHEIEFKYYLPGLRLGVVISFIGVLLVFLSFLIYNIYGKGIKKK